MLIISEPQVTCKLGQGSECCIFLVMYTFDFECTKGTDLGFLISEKNMDAKGKGDWPECLYNKQRRGV